MKIGGMEITCQEMHGHEPILMIHVHKTSALRHGYRHAFQVHIAIGGLLHYLICVYWKSRL
jgi:hypothetical protein